MPPRAVPLDEFLGGGELRGAAIRPDGREILMVLRGPDGWSLATLPSEGGEPRRLPSDPPLAGERLLALSPRGDTVLFRRPLARQGEAAVLALRQGSGRVLDLTIPGTGRARLLGWSSGGSGVLLESDEIQSGRRDVVEVRLDDLSHALRLSNDLDLRLGPLSPDGRSLAVAATDPALGPGIGILDLASGSIREAGVADESRGWLLPQAFTADGRALVAFDARARPYRTVRVLLENGRRSPVETPCDDPLGFQISPAGRFALWTCRSAEQTALVLTDLATGARHAPPLPRGIAPRAIRFSTDDRTLLIEAGGPTHGDDLFLWLPDLPTDRQLTYLVDPRLEADDLVVPVPFALPGGGSARVTAAELRPRRDASAARPAILLLEDADEEERMGPPVFQPLAQYFANHGHRVLHLAWRAPGPQRPPASDSPTGSADEAEKESLLAVLSSLGRTSTGAVLLGHGRRSAGLALLAAARPNAAWSAVGAVLPGRSTIAPPIGDGRVASAAMGDRRPPPDWIDALPEPRPGTRLLVVSCDADALLPQLDRDRLLAKLTRAGVPPILELERGDAACLERPEARESAWSAVARFARAAGTPAP